MSLLDNLRVVQSVEETIVANIKAITKWTSGENPRDDQYLMKFDVGTGENKKTVTAFCFEATLGKVPQIPFGGLEAEIDLRETERDGETYTNVVGVRLNYAAVANPMVIAAICGNNFSL